MKVTGFFIALFLSVSYPVFARRDIKTIDFRNFSYRLRCGDADVVSRVVVKNGEFSGDKRGLHVSLSVYQVVYGDLNRDGKREAVVLYSCGSGASYVYFRGLIFAMKRGRPAFVTSLEGGNKADGGFHTVRVRKGFLIVERYEVGVAGSPCCAETIRTTKYRLSGTKLLQVGDESYRKVRDGYR